MTRAAARVLPAVLAGAALGACAGDPIPELPAPRLIEVPAAAGAGQPFASAYEGGVLVSWIEPAAAGSALRFARWDGLGWSEPRTVAEGADWFVNWADFPSIVQAGDVLAAHWLQRSGPGRYSYDIMLTQSQDDGATWSPPLRPHRDGTETEHGFVSLFPYRNGLGAVWLDGRAFEDADPGVPGHGSGEMQVRFTAVGPDGALADEMLLDDRACDCCQTAAVNTSSGPFVVYRDRSPDEVRDIAVTRLIDGAWTAPARLHEDGWVIAGCPVNGPAADGEGERVAVAWFTAADEQPRVNVTFSEDAGGSFGEAIRVDGGDPAGRVDVLLISPGVALVVWLENAGDGAELRGRLVSASGRTGPARVLATTSAERASGFPRMARHGNNVLLLWTQAGDPSMVRAAVLPFDP